MTVSVNYDPMLAKLIVYGGNAGDGDRRGDRGAARTTRFSGIRTNMPFLLAMLEHPQFAAAMSTRGFIDTEAAALAGATPLPDVWRAVAMAPSTSHVPAERRQDRGLAGTDGDADTAGATDARNGGRDSHGIAGTGGVSRRPRTGSTGVTSVRPRRRPAIATAWVVCERTTARWVFVDGAGRASRRRSAALAGRQAHGALTAPMPATVVAIHVAARATRCAKATR